MKIIGIIYICIGIVFTVLYTLREDKINTIQAVIVFICGLTIILINKG